MKKLDQLNRKAHLYLGLLLMPWVLLYGVSSLLISHPAWFRSHEEPPWQSLWERHYDRPVSDDVGLRELGRSILEDCDLAGAFWIQRREPGQIQITRFRVTDQTRLTYSVADQRLRAERQELPRKQVLLRLHFRGGFLQDRPQDILWGILVDVVCIGILIWIGSGLLMWWRLNQLRAWGLITLGGGTLTFLALVVLL